MLLKSLMQVLKELQKHLKGEQAEVGMVLGNKEEVGTGRVVAWLVQWLACRNYAVGVHLDLPAG